MQYPELPTGCEVKVSLKLGNTAPLVDLMSIRQYWLMNICRKAMQRQRMSARNFLATRTPWTERVVMRYCIEITANRAIFRRTVMIPGVPGLIGNRRRSYMDWKAEGIPACRMGNDQLENPLCQWAMVCEDEI